jgi:hypothetical protein
MNRHAFPLAVAATISALVLSGCGDDEPDNADDPASTPASDTSDPTPSDATTTPSEEPSETVTTTDTGSTETVPGSVFFVGDTPQGPRLFAEHRELEADNPLDEALAMVVAGDSADPDYRTLVPAGSIETHAGFDGVGDDGLFSVSLTDDQWTERPAGMSKAEARLAVQQVVYTLQHQAGGDEPTSAAVTFYLESDAVSFLGVPSDVKAADELSTRALVNVTAPAEGATVSGSFTASGEASSFEATVPWQIRDESGQMVLNGFSTAEGWIDGLYPWETDVDVSSLTPGTYTFVAMTDDPSGGEGAGPTEDTKTIVVE